MSIGAVKKGLITLFLSVLMMSALLPVDSFADGSRATVTLDPNGGSFSKTAVEALTADDISGLVAITVDSAGLIRVTVDP